jgi:hypothetical protein
LLRAHDWLGGDDDLEESGAQIDRRRPGCGTWLIPCCSAPHARLHSKMSSGFVHAQPRIAPRDDIATDLIQDLIKLLLEHEYLELVDTRDRAIVGTEKPPYRVVKGVG